MEAPVAQPPSSKTSPPDERLFSGEYQGPHRWTGQPRPQQLKRKTCDSCGEQLRSNAPWFCAGDAIYCSQTCRTPNLPFVAKKTPQSSPAKPPGEPAAETSHDCGENSAHDEEGSATAVVELARQQLGVEGERGSGVSTVPDLWAHRASM